MYLVTMVDKPSYYEEEIGEYSYEAVKALTSGYTRTEFPFYDIYDSKKTNHYYRVQRIGVKENWGNIV